jgi:membrane protease YdiL (CAAX protease family)
MINTTYKTYDGSDEQRKTPETYNNSMHPFMQLLLFAGIFIGAMVFGNLLGAGIIIALYGLKAFMAIASLTLTDPHTISALWILQLTGTTLPIFATPVFFAYVVVHDPADYIKPTFKFPWVLMIVVFAIMFVSSPLIEFLSNINQKMVLPPFLQWMRDSEDNAKKITDIMLQMKTVWSMIFDLLFIGLLTAVVEEFMFRGCLQTIFTRWTKNKHAAIWITAILFSAFHMEFFGFLPRMMLGVLFGYFVAWSGSIWPAVWAHFINNGTAVVVTYLFQHKIINMDPDDQHVFNYLGYILSFIIVLFLFWVYHSIAQNKKQVQL